MGVLDGQVACITGGTRGIGLAIASAFLDEGANVVINGRDAAKAQRSMDELGAGDRIHFIGGNVKKREDCEAIVNGTAAHFGRLDILVPNAGGGSDYAPIAQMTDEAMQDALVWSFWHTFWTMRAALNLMIPNNSGRIIAMSSVEGKMGKPGISSYVVAKHAVNGLVKSVAREVGTLGITVNAILPGLIETDIVRDTGPASAIAMGLESYDAMIGLFTQESALKRPNKVEEVAAVAVLMATDAARNMTGCLFPVDGGTMPY